MVRYWVDRPKWAGKSTTFHSILNFLSYEGTISWNDQTINETVFDQIGYLPEERSLMPKLTVEQQILYLAQLKGQPARKIKGEIDDWLQRFEVKGKRTDKIRALSKGNQQKIQLICTLIHRPSLIILDEPFSGLDPVNVDLLEQAILTAKQQAPPLFSPVTIWVTWRRCATSWSCCATATWCCTEKFAIFVSSSVNQRSS